LDILQQYIGAVTEMYPPHSVADTKIRRIPGIFCECCLSKKIEAVNLLCPMSVVQRLVLARGA
jgi:hypothetical protein